MNKILKILSILVIGFVMFSCSTPTNDPTPYIPEPSGSETPVETPSDDTEPSGPETPVETPSDDPVEETPEVKTYSIIFTAKNPEFDQPIADLLNRLDTYNKVEKGKEVELPTIIYQTISGEYKIDKPNDLNVILSMNYEGNVTPVKVENENIKVKVENENIKIKFWTTPAE